MAMETIGKSQKKKNAVATVLMIILFTILAILIILPIYAIFMASFHPGNFLLQYGLNLDPDFANMTLSNYVLLFTGDHDYWIWFGNSLLLTVLTVVLTLIISSFVAVVLPFLAHASTIFFFRQYLLGLPKSLIEAGRIDGATEYGIFFKLIVPIMKPAFSAMAILNGMNAWNNYMWPLLVIRSSEKYTLTIGLNTLINPYGDNYSLLVVGSVFSIIPIFILFICFQRYFIEGMTAGAVKG